LPSLQEIAVLTQLRRDLKKALKSSKNSNKNSIMNLKYSAHVNQIFRLAVEQGIITTEDK